MTDRTVRLVVAIGLGACYVGLLGYSVFGYSGPTPDEEMDADRTIPPRVMYHDDDVDVYSRRSVRSSGQRGGGLRGGK